MHLTCAPISVSPSNISTMYFPEKKDDLFQSSWWKMNKKFYEKHVYFFIRWFKSKIISETGDLISSRHLVTSIVHKNVNFLRRKFSRAHIILINQLINLTLMTQRYKNNILNYVNTGFLFQGYNKVSRSIRKSSFVSLFSVAFFLPLYISLSISLSHRIIFKITLKYHDH